MKIAELITELTFASHTVGDVEVQIHLQDNEGRIYQRDIQGWWTYEEDGKPIVVLKAESFWDIEKAEQEAVQ
jgi:hypothetical protein